MVVRELNLQQDQSNPNNYFLWQISTPLDVINHFVNQSNEYTTNLFGDTRTAANAYALCKQYAVKKAALYLVQEGAINWQVSGLRAQLGNLSVDRLAALKEAATLVSTRLEQEIYRLYIMLSDIVTVNAYAPISPLIDVHGSTFYS